MLTHVVHSAVERTSRVLRVSLFVTLAYIVLLVVAGIRAHSLALLSEAGHNLSDFFALLLSLFAVYLQSRPPSSTATYGYHRAGVLAALVNAASLVAVSFLIFYEAFGRLQAPQHVHAGVMIGVAAAGVIMNGVIALLLYRSGRKLARCPATLPLLIFRPQSANAFSGTSKTGCIGISASTTLQFNLNTWSAKWRTDA